MLPTNEAADRARGEQNPSVVLQQLVWLVRDCRVSYGHDAVSGAKTLLERPHAVEEVKPLAASLVAVLERAIGREMAKQLPTVEAARNLGLI